MITAADVASWADLDLDPEAETLMERVVAAVLAHAAAHYVIPEEIDADEHADLALGLTMQAARLYRRRLTPDGVTAFGDSFAIRVGRFDPDVDQMLAAYQVWAVG